MTTWVLLRGLARESRHWGGFAAALRQRLPAGQDVAPLDLPGNGRRWREPSPTAIEEMVDSARAEMKASPHQPPFLLVAISLGGMAALHWSAAAPAEVAGCVLINSSVGALSPWRHRLRPAAYPTLLGLLAPGRGARSREAAVLRLTSNQPLRAALAPQWAEYAAECPVSRMNFLRQLLAAARWRGAAAPPPVPLLLLAARHDRMVSVHCSRAMARAWGVPLREHPAAGHDLPLDDPDWVIAQLLSWQQETAQPPRMKDA